MLLLGPAAEPFSGAPFLLLGAALVLDALFGRAFGPFLWVPHPVRIAGAAIAIAERKLNRPQRSATDRRLRGLVLALTLPAAAAIVGYGVAWLSRSLPYGAVLELLALVPLLAQRSLYAHVGSVALALLQGGLSSGRKAVAQIVGRDVTRLDEHGVARAAIESCAENFSDGVVAPAFWYLLFGLPGVCLYKTVSTLDSMIGHRTDRYRDFGMASARFDDLLNLLPARLSGMILAAAACLVPTASAQMAFAVMRRDSRLPASPNAGWPEAAMAGALGLALGGPRAYAGDLTDDPWLNREGRVEATVLDIGRALWLYVVACALHLIVVLGIGLALAAG